MTIRIKVKLKHYKSRKSILQAIHPKAQSHEEETIDMLKSYIYMQELFMENFKAY